MPVFAKSCFFCQGRLLLGGHFTDILLGDKDKKQSELPRNMILLSPKVRQVEEAYCACS